MRELPFIKLLEERRILITFDSSALRRTDGLPINNGSIGAAHLEVPVGGGTSSALLS